MPRMIFAESHVSQLQSTDWAKNIYYIFTVFSIDYIYACQQSKFSLDFRAT